MSDKLTKQGVRDLDALYPKPKRVKAEAPPEKVLRSIYCRHVRIRQLESGDTHCPDCSVIWDWNGIPYD